MTQIALTLYAEPYYAETFITLKRLDGNYQRLVAIIDTGAAVSLLPLEMLSALEASVVSKIVVEQAGIAHQAFEAIEAIVKLKLEDMFGNRTPELNVTVWFAETDVALVGFAGILDRATLYLDYRDKREGWLTFDDV